MRKHIEFVLVGLSAEEQIIFSLKQSEGFDFEEVANIADITINKLKENSKTALNYRSVL